MKTSINTRRIGVDMHRKLFLVLVGITVIGAVLVLTLMQVLSVRSGPQASTQTPTYALTPVDPSLLPLMPTAIQPEVVDLAPDIPYDEKPSVVVQHPDSSRTMYLVAPDELDAFVNNLPEGDELKLIISAPSLMRTQQPPEAP